MGGAKTTLVLKTVTCVATANRTLDKICVRCSIDQGPALRFPASGHMPMSVKAPTNVWNPELSISFYSTLTISLYDCSTDREELLGSYTYQTDNPPQPSNELMAPKTHSAQYELSTAFGIPGADTINNDRARGARKDGPRRDTLERTRGTAPGNVGQKDTPHAFDAEWGIQRHRIVGSARKRAVLPGNELLLGYPGGLWKMVGAAR